MNVGANLLRYSNGWGHLIVTALTICALTVALLTGKISDTAAAGILAPVIAFWFMSGSANRFAVLNPTTEKQITVPLPPPSPLPPEDQP